MSTKPTWTMVDRGTITLGGTEVRVEEQVNDADGSRIQTWIHGRRGATYFLRGYLERSGDSGIRQVISWKSGAPLRRRGNEVRVIEIAGHIEEHVKGARR